MTLAAVITQVESLQGEGLLSEDDVLQLARAILLSHGYSIVSRETAARASRIEALPFLAKLSETRDVLYALRVGQSDYWAAQAKEYA